MAGLLVLSALLLADPAPGGSADVFNTSLQQAGQSYSDNPRESLQYLRQAVISLWPRLPLEVWQWRLLQDAPTPEGRYQLRDEQPFAAGEPMILYLEPVGFTVKEEDGLFNYHLVVDFNMVDAWGHVVGGRRQFSTLQGPALSFPDHLSMVISYNLLGLTPGEYRIETTLRDLLGKQTYTLTTPLQIVTPTQ